MTTDRLAAQEESRIFLDKEKEKYPELFPETMWVDDNSALEPLGIHIPGKEKLPKGYLKLLPSDFIVEEITLEGEQTTVSESSGGFQDLPGDTVYATLVKCGLSTLEAVDEIASKLSIPKDKIQYAGIKDKDAITSQTISLRGVKKDDVLNVSSSHFFLKDIRTGKGVVQKGGLKANRFSILMRIGEDLKDKKLMNNSLEAIQKVKSEGFYNFFYLQRFGSPRLNNYKWGISILKGDYEKAVKGLIADPGLRELPYFVAKRKDLIALAPDWEAMLASLKELPLVFQSEIKMVEYLVNHPDDYRGALMKIDDQITLWVSAVASLLFNRRMSSYLLAGMEPPASLPWMISPERNDWLPYAEDMESIDIFPPDFSHLRPFPKITIAHKDIKTKDQVEFNKAEIVNEGIVLQFTLGKGEYATTFLSHFINLLGGKSPEDLNKEPVDVKVSLNDGNMDKTLEFFSPINKTK